MAVSSAQKKRSSRAPKKAPPKKGLGQHRQVIAILLFAVGVLILCLTYIKGSNVWTFFHHVILGLFGISSVLVAPIIIYVAVLIAMDKSSKTIAFKLIIGGVMILLFSGLFQVLAVGVVEGNNFIDKLARLYENGTQWRGGGLVSALLGWSFMSMFGNIGATLVLTLLLFVFFMLLSGKTLMQFFHAVYKPVEKVGKGIKTQGQHLSEYHEQRRLQGQEKRRRGEIFDVEKCAGFKENETSPDEEMPEHPVASQQLDIETLEEAQKKLGKQKKEPVSPQLEELIQKAMEENGADNKKMTAAEVAGQSQAVSEEIKEAKLYQDKDQVAVYNFPSLDLLNPPKETNADNISEELKQNAATLVDTLKSFGVQTRIVDISRGPTVTRYELQPSAGVKISKITGLSDDIALNLASAGVRIEAPIPNKAAVGIEVPNKVVDVVTIREILDSKEFAGAQSRLTVALGKDIAGNITLADLAKMPHLLIAGSTGSGKSVCINSIIISLLYKSSPDEVRILMIDPKVVELGIYNGIPHLLIPVVTDPRKAAGALGWAVTEMLNRYKLFADNNVRDLKGYNNAARSSGEMDPLPEIVIIIDELADLMMAAPGEVEDSICRLAQMARAAGMHLVIATQRPSVDVITGVIKANIPSRIAFAVSSQVDSRTILDGSGAEKLLGRGDMLFYPTGMPKPLRVQGCFTSDPEVEKVVGFIKGSENADYDQGIMEEIERQAQNVKGGDSDKSESGDDECDEMLAQAVECVLDAGQASTSYLQRRLKLGYARAARLIDDMEARGIVGPFEGSKPRQVLISRAQWMEMSLNPSSALGQSEEKEPF